MTMQHDNPMREFTLMESLRSESQCVACGEDKGRLVLCWTPCWRDYIDSGLPLDKWLDAKRQLPPRPTVVDWLRWIRCKTTA